MTSQKYNRYAAECVLLAEKTDDPITKLTMVGLARAWLGIAELAENNSQTDVVYETHADTRE